MKRELFNQTCFNRIPPKVLLRYLLLIAAILLSSILFVWNAEIIPLNDDDFRPLQDWLHIEYLWQSYLTIILLWGFLYFLTQNWFVSFVVMEAATLIFGIANRVTLVSRKEFISAADLKIAREAAGVKADVIAVFDVMWLILFLIALLPGVVFFCWNYRWSDKTVPIKKKIWILRIIGLLTTTGLFLYIHALQPVEVMLSPTLSSAETGAVTWFFSGFFDTSSHDISLKELSWIYKRYQKRLPGDSNVSAKRPNIIVIMSEAFWDINTLDVALEMSSNPMDYYDEVTRNAITGQVAVNVYGGGTNTSEFEFLTGINTANITDIKDYYGELYANKQESMFSYMKELGYSTIALHPYLGEYWDRNTAYYNMGCDVFYDEEDFQNREMCHGYISDHSLTLEIIERFHEQKETNPDKPVFSFAVSVQNHVNDLSEFDETHGKDGCTEITAQVTDREITVETQEDLTEYVNGLNKSIVALEELMNYFENYEEDTIIVFFGDHAPPLLTGLYGEDAETDSPNWYRTPYMIWTNYENDYTGYGDMNISGLSAVLIDYLDLPKTNQYYINMYLVKNNIIQTKFETSSLDQAGKRALVEYMYISNYVCNHFPEQEYALSFW